MVLLRILRRAALGFAALAAIPVVVVGVSLATASVAQAAPLSSIQVSGNVRIDTETIRSYVTVDFGQEITQAGLNNTLGVLFATGFFANVSVTSSGSTIFIAVVENAIVVQVTFEGNQRVRDPELFDVIQTVVRGVLSEPRLAADVRAIEDRYREAGRGGAVVQVSVQQLEGNLAAVTFNIIEGERVRIAGITFEGNEAFSDWQLRSVIETRQSSVLTLISRRDVYSPDGMLLDQELLRRYYLQNGYADFQVLTFDVVYDDASFEYSIRIVVSEGPRYTFGAVAVDSAIPGITADSLRRAIHIRSGQVFNALDLERSLEDITLAVAEAGNPFVQVTPRANRNYATNEIDITFRIDPGARVYVERIDIIGNTRTRDYVARREFREISEGDAFNRVLVDRVERRLRNLGIFQSVEIDVIQGSAPDFVVLRVTVTEQRTGEVSAVAGYSTADGILGEISFSESNFLGRGQQLRASFTIGVNNRNFAVSFTEPYFMGRNLPFGFDIYRRTTTASATRPYGEAIIGGQVRLGLPITESVGVQFAYRINQQIVSGSTSAYYADGTYLTSSISLTGTINTIDNLRDPRQGIFIRTGVEYAGLGGNVTFLRTTLDARWYQPIGYRSNMVGLLRFQAGNITDPAGGMVRTFDNFHLGGETIRGFANLGFGPREVAAPMQALGGKTYWAATAEVSFPIPFLPEDFGLRGAVFADAGMLFGVDDPGFPAFSNDMTLRASVGASLLWASPIGLLRLDFARVLSSAPYDQLQAIRFGVGAQF
jgi:outer membrane protein insertion porin family